MPAGATKTRFKYTANVEFYNSKFKETLDVSFLTSKLSKNAKKKQIYQKLSTLTSLYIKIMYLCGLKRFNSKQTNIINLKPIYYEKKFYSF